MPANTSTVRASQGADAVGWETRPPRRFFVAFSSYIAQHVRTTAQHTRRRTYFDDIVEAPPALIYRRPVRLGQAGEVRHRAARQRAVAVSPLEHADQASARVPIRELARVLGETAVERRRDVAVVPRHGRVLVLACVEAAAITAR